MNRVNIWKNGENKIMNDIGCKGLIIQGTTSTRKSFLIGGIKKTLKIDSYPMSNSPLLLRDL